MRPPRPARRTGVLAGCVAGVLASALVGATPVAASDVTPRPGDDVLVFDGRGFGHGRGLSQYGAHGAALRGLSAAQVLAHYYPGAVLGTAPGAVRRVLITAEDADAVVTNAPGLVLRDVDAGTTVPVGARGDWASVRVRSTGPALQAEALQGGTWVAVAPPSAGPVQLEGPAALRLQRPDGARDYRGTLRVTRSGDAAKPVYVVNTVGSDDYVRGVVAAEMPSGWHLEALKAQAVAARSYGLQPCPQPRTYPATGLYDVVDTTACQVYGGVTAQTPRTDEAVRQTADQVLRYGGAVLRAEFSASNGGRTVAAGGPFVAGDDPYDEVGASAVGAGAVHRWTGVRVPVSRLEAAFGTGRLTEVRVLAREGGGEWGGRVTRVRLTGQARTVEVTGVALRQATGLRSEWFSVYGATAIDVKHAQLGGDAGLLGPASGPEHVLPDGRFRLFRGGSVYWSPGTGAHEVHGSIRDRWQALGWEGGVLGYPTTDEVIAPDRAGRYNHFTGGSVYWSPRTRPSAVVGSIREAWARNGWELGPLGYPVSDELVTADGTGRVSRFQGGSAWWSPTTGAAVVHGSLHAAYTAAGAERGPLGYPRTDELRTPDGRGRYNHFAGGSAYWSSATGAHVVRGGVLDRWAAERWEAGRLGYPTRDVVAVPGGLRGEFERGTITWDAATGASTVTLR